MGGHSAVARQIVDIIEKNFVQFGEITGLGAPVVFLKVDVGGIVAAPGRSEAFVPQALKIGRNGMCTRA